jgi:hypothetical protein
VRSTPLDDCRTSAPVIHDRPSNNPAEQGPSREAETEASSPILSSNRPNSEKSCWQSPHPDSHEDRSPPCIRVSGPINGHTAADVDEHVSTRGVPKSVPRGLRHHGQNFERALRPVRKSSAVRLIAPRTPVPAAVQSHAPYPPGHRGNPSSPRLRSSPRRTRLGTMPYRKVMQVADSSPPKSLFTYCFACDSETSVFPATSPTQSIVRVTGHPPTGMCLRSTVRIRDSQLTA